MAVDADHVEMRHRRGLRDRSRGHRRTRRRTCSTSGRWKYTDASSHRRRDSRAATPALSCPSPSPLRSARASSGIDSTLKHLTPASSASRISAAVLPTPENTVFSALPPAASTRASSPPETMSKPAPSRANTFSTARLLFALTATWIGRAAAGASIGVGVLRLGQRGCANRRRAACRTVRRATRRTRLRRAARRRRRRMRIESCESLGLKRRGDVADEAALGAAASDVRSVSGDSVSGVPDGIGQRWPAACPGASPVVRCGCCARLARIRRRRLRAVAWTLAGSGGTVGKIERTALSTAGERTPPRRRKWPKPLQSRSSGIRLA